MIAFFVHLTSGSFLRKGLLLFLLLLLPACSSTTFVYNRLDFLLPWYLDRYVDLDRGQSAVLDAQLDDLLDWHRREELPRYVDFLDEIRRDLDAPLTVARLQDYTDRGEQAWFRVRDPGLEQLLVLAESLNAEQIQDFNALMQKKQKKYEDKYLDRDDGEFREDVFESMQDTLEDYLGRLDKSQKERLRQAVAGIVRSDAIWLRERSLWIGEVAQALRREPGWQQQLTAIVAEWEDQLDPDVEATYDHNTAVVQAAIVDVVNSRSDKQNSRLLKKLAGLRDDLTLLISQGDN